jgi:hypothetical protein
MRTVLLQQNDVTARCPPRDPRFRQTVFDAAAGEP